MSTISINIILSSLEEATQFHHFNYVIKRYKKCIIESEKLFNIFKGRAILVMNTHSSPKEANIIHDMLEDLESERDLRIQFLKSSGKPIIDAYDVPNRERELAERNQKIELKEINRAKIAERISKLNKPIVDTQLKKKVYIEQIEDLLNKKEKARLDNIRLKSKPLEVYIEYNERLNGIERKIDKLTSVITELLNLPVSEDRVN